VSTENRWRRGQRQLAGDIHRRDLISEELLKSQEER